MADSIEPEIEDLIDGMELLPDWQERYRYIIDLGRKLPPMPEEERVEENLVRGCVSQVWLTRHPGQEDPQNLHFHADSDSHIMKGLVAILMMMYDEKPPERILAVDSRAIFEKMELAQHLSPLRSNGLASLVKAIRLFAAAAAAGGDVPPAAELPDAEAEDGSSPAT